MGRSVVHGFQTVLAYAYAYASDAGHRRAAVGAPEPLTGMPPLEVLAFRLSAPSPPSDTTTVR